MTRLLPTPPKAALRAALHDLGASGRYRSFAILPDVAHNLRVECSGAAQQERRRIDRSLSQWGREFCAAFAPLSLTYAGLHFAPEISRPLAASRAAASRCRPPLLSLARRIADEWSNASVETSRVTLFLSLARVDETGALERRMHAVINFKHVLLEGDDADASWTAQFEPWLAGVSALNLEFLWSRPTAHFLAAVANAEAAA